MRRGRTAHLLRGSGLEPSLLRNSSNQCEKKWESAYLVRDEGFTVEGSMKQLDINYAALFVNCSSIVVLYPKTDVEGAVIILD